jgi:hypothetical protein
MENFTLGDRLIITAVAVKGYIPVETTAEYIRDIIDLIGMNTAGMAPQIWVFPLPTGQGGVGETHIQPMYNLVHPLVESFSNGIGIPPIPLPGMVGMDTWKDVGKWYLVIQSCKPHSAQEISDYLIRRGHVVSEPKTMTIE